jgi:hypothetical protein
MAAVLAAGLVRPSPAAAQSLPVTVFNDLKYGVGDILSVWTAPFRGEARDYRTAALVVAGVGATVMLDDEIADWIRENPNAFALEALDPFRERDSKPKLVDLGAGTSLVQIGGSLYLLGLAFGSEDLRDAGIGCVAAEKSNGLPRHFIYKGVSRERPLYKEISGVDTIFRPGDPYDIRFPGDEDDWYDNSFFGGHGANIMACASFLNHRFDLGLAEPVLWTVAVGVNLGRAADQRHWASDVVIGGVVGYAIGKYVAERSLDRKADRLRADNGGAGGGRGEADGSLKDAVLSGLWMTQQDGRTLVGWKRSF